MKKNNKKSQPEASAPGNPSIQPATTDQCFAWTFASMASNQALDAINRGEQPELSMLVLSEDGDASLSRIVPSLMNGYALFDVVARQSSTVHTARLAFGFAVSGAGHLLAGVEEAFVVFTLSNKSATAFAIRIERNRSGKADLVEENIVVENPLRLLSHAFGFIDHAPDTKERRELWTGILKNNRR